MDNVVLIGFMGVGKGRTGRALAARLGRVVLDTDDLIESMVKRKVREIFAEAGEAHFRALERRVAEWLEHSVRDTIVSTGGGFFQVPNLRRIGQVVYLHAEVEEIISAMQAHPRARRKFKKRPLLADLDAARTLFAQRLPHYRAVADLEVRVAGRSIEAVAGEIAGMLGLDAAAGPPPRRNA